MDSARWDCALGCGRTDPGFVRSIVRERLGKAPAPGGRVADGD